VNLIMKAMLLALGMLAMFAVVANASECPNLQAQIDKQFGTRFDNQAAAARAMAAQAAGLHKAGKHADSVKAYDDAAKAGGMQLMHKK
jgi:hypothetical protein